MFVWQSNRAENPTLVVMFLGRTVYPVNKLDPSTVKKTLILGIELTPTIRHVYSPLWLWSTMGMFREPLDRDIQLLQLLALII